jgi:hypothetical protein
MALTGVTRETQENGTPAEVRNLEGVTEMWSLLLFRNMDNQIIKTIEAILAKGDRVELIPTRDGVEVIHIKREKVKTK